MNLFQNALALDPQNVSTLVLLVAAAAWVGVVLVLLSDLFADSRLSIMWKLLWLPVLLGVPVIGGFIYGVVGLIRGIAHARHSS